MRLAPDRAPPAATPRRFLLSVPLWGLFAAVLLMTTQAEALVSRWQPATLALTHACTLGVLGNAMFGSLLQFLPAAAGVRVRGGVLAANIMHAALNAGALLLVAGFLTSSPRWLVVAAVLLLGAFVLLAATTLPGLCAGVRQQRVLRTGLAVAILGGGATAVLGGGAALATSGRLALPLSWLVDVHAAWGTLGWVLLLLVVVGREVMPMFQGSARWPTSIHLLAMPGLPLALLVASVPALQHGDADALRVVTTLASGAFAVFGLWLQRCTGRLRNTALRAFWRAGWLALLGAALALSRHNGMLAGVLGIGIAAPLLITGMLLEIGAFIAWVDLQRRCARGVRVPAIQQLLPTSRKWATLYAMIVAAAMLAAAALYPSRWLTLLAGASWLLAWASVTHALYDVQRRAALFAHAHAR